MLKKSSIYAGLRDTVTLLHLEHRKNHLYIEKNKNIFLRWEFYYFYPPRVRVHKKGVTVLRMTKNPVFMRVCAGTQNGTQR